MSNEDLLILLLYDEIFGHLEECDKRTQCDCIKCERKERIKIIKEMVK